MKYYTYLILLTLFFLFFKNHLFAIDNLITREKIELLNVAYSHNKRTFMCNCSFDKIKVNYDDCSYFPKVNNDKAHEVKWKQLINSKFIFRRYPEWKLGHNSCKTKKGDKYKRKKCVKKLYKNELKLINNDLHLYYPIIKQISIMMRNKRFGTINKERRKFGECNLEIGKLYIEPRDSIKGDIARTFLYFSENYMKNNFLKDKQKKLFKTWSSNDPVDQWECERNKNIKKLTGISNNILDHLCEKYSK